jgi:hypothetical protein
MLSANQITIGMSRKGNRRGLRVPLEDAGTCDASERRTRRQRVMEEWATLRELSHGGSNRHDDCGHFCGYPAICDRGCQVLRWECRQKLRSIV